MLRDNRDPEQLGQTLLQLKRIHPDKTAAERADILDEVHRISHYAYLTSNGTTASGNGR